MKNEIIHGSVINPFGERCFLKYIKGGQTECCFYDTPCEQHSVDKINENRSEELKEACIPLLKLLNNGNYHPHMKVIVTATSIELLEGSCSIPEILDFVKD